MFKSFKFSLRPMMDELDSAGGAVATSQTTETTTSTESTSGDTTGSASTSTDADIASQKAVQTPEQNSAFAELRRKSEAAEKRAIEVEAQLKRDREIAKKYGKEYNIYSDDDVAEQFGESHGIKTIAEFEEALKRQEYKAKGIDPEMINKLIEDHPAIKQAKANEEAMAKAQQDRLLVDNYSELQKEFPEVTKPDDVPADVWKRWNDGKSGLTLTEAYTLINRKAILDRSVDAAKQAALNNINSKDHIRGNGKGTETDTTRIPDDVLAMYKKFNPGKSMDEYKAHYKKSL